MDINLKNIDSRNSSDLYKELEKLVKFKDYHAVVKDENNYYLGGLTIKDIKKASVSQEDIQKLHSGLKERNIHYAIKESDINKGYIPLILNDHTRSFLRNNLKGILNSDNLIWRIFYIPYEIVENQLILKNADLLIENKNEYHNSPYVLKYDEIEKRLKDIISIDVENNEQPSEKEIYNEEYKEILSADLFDSGNESKSESESNISDKHKSEDNTEENDEIDTYTSNQENTNSIDEEPTQTNSEEIKFDYSNDLELISEKDDTKIPTEIDSFLSSLYLGRFSEYESVDKDDTTLVLMQKETKNANDAISVREENIKRKAKELYFRYMEQSVKKIREVIDLENGDELVKNRHVEAKGEKSKLDNELEEKIGIHKQELVEKFWNKHFIAYKKKTLDNLEFQFEKDEYYNLVSEPLERFITYETNRIDERKDKIDIEVSKWKEDIKKTALEADRDNAIIEVEEYINNAIKTCQKEISELEKKLNTHNDKFLKHEYSKKAEQNLRNSLSDELKTDEEAKRFKKKFEQTEKEKQNLMKDLEDLEEKYINDFENIKEDREHIEKEIEEKHKKILSDKENEISELKDKTTELENERESNKKQLENRKKKSKKKVIGTSIAATVLVFVLGGASISSHHNNNQIQGKLDDQSKTLQQKTDEVDKRDSEIKKLKAEQDKQKAVITQQKKDLDKKKDKKDDKKKDKK